jgi:hypothetical protein
MPEQQTDSLANFFIKALPLPDMSGIRKPPAIACAPTGVVWLCIAPK